jgi:hypothetical protein
MAAFRRQIEMGIDAIAHSIAPFFPLPTWQFHGSGVPDSLHLLGDDRGRS